MQIDVSVNNLLPLYNTRLLRSYAEVDTRVKVLILCVKRWARLHGLAGAKTNNLSSYAWVLVVIYYLQVRSVENGDPSITVTSRQLNGVPLLPSLQQLATSRGTVSVFQDPSTGRKHDVGCVDNDEIAKELVEISRHNFALTCSSSNAELLQGFFYFYAHVFKWGDEVVSIRLGERKFLSSSRFGQLPRGIFSHADGHPAALPVIHIEDPFELQRNLNCVLDQTAVTRLKAAFGVSYLRVAPNNSYDALIVEARTLFALTSVILPVRGFYDETADSPADQRRVDLW